MGVHLERLIDTASWATISSVLSKNRENTVYPVLHKATNKKLYKGLFT